MSTLKKQLGVSTTSTIENTKRKEVTLPGTPSRDFIVTARCRILNVRGRLSITAADLPGEQGGTFTWGTDSRNIQLENATGPKITVTAFSFPSKARDSEVVTVTRRAPDGTEKSKTIALTVAEVRFAASPRQRYGFDDNDTPVDDDDNHLSVQSGGHTFVSVKIRGGVDSSDFDFHVSSAAVCEADQPPAGAEFDLRIVGKKALKATASLTARVKCLSKEVFAKLTVHVYEKRVVKVVIAKFADASRPGTALQWENDDYTKHGIDAQPWLQEAVVQLRMKNLSAPNQVTNISFDGCANDALVYDFAKNGGEMIERFSAAFDSYKDFIKVVIVRNIEFQFHLKSYAQSGESTITVEGKSLLDGDIRIGRGAHSETNKIVSFNGNVGTLASPLRNSYPPGEVILPSVIGVSGPLIFISETSAGRSEMKWVVVHEVLHKALGLRDILDKNNIMHHKKDFLDYRLRFSPRKLARSEGYQNQWEHIDRFRIAPEEPEEGLEQ